MYNSLCFASTFVAQHFWLKGLIIYERITLGGFKKLQQKLLKVYIQLAIQWCSYDNFKSLAN